MNFDELVSEIRKKAREDGEELLNSHEVMVPTTGWLENYGVRPRFSSEDRSRYLKCCEEQAISRLFNELFKLAFKDDQ